MRQRRWRVSLASTHRQQRRRAIERLPSDEALQEILFKNNTVPLRRVARVLGLTHRQLRCHMQRRGLSRHPAPPANLPELIDGVRTGAFSNYGCTMVQGLLRAKGVNVTRYRVMKVLQRADPGGARRRKRRRLRRRTYRVGGPRSLYHADGHEKLAKVFGIWIHGTCAACALLSNIEYFVFMLN